MGRSGVRGSCYLLPPVSSPAVVQHVWVVFTRFHKSLVQRNATSAGSLFHLLLTSLLWWSPFILLLSVWDINSSASQSLTRRTDIFGCTFWVWSWRIAVRNAKSKGEGEWPCPCQLWGPTLGVREMSAPAHIQPGLLVISMEISRAQTMNQQEEELFCILVPAVSKFWLLMHALAVIYFSITFLTRAPALQL